MANAEIMVNSERYTFITYWDVERYDNGKRFVFCDELKGYTFCPYTGGLKSVPAYCENREVFEDAQIFLIKDISGKLIKIPCNIVESCKKIFINDGNFNKYWKRISEKLGRGMEEENNTLQTSVNQMVDLSLLENPVRSAVINDAYVIEYKGKKQDIELQRMISKRAEAMDDCRIRFVYAKSNQLVHDKACKDVEKIPYWDFGASKELPDNRVLCPHCIRKIYIRNAIKGHAKNATWYFRFMDKGRVGTKVLERFLYDKNTKIHMDNLEELRVMHKEDTWIIRMNEQGMCRLYHNNYTILDENERYITDGFHEQKNHPMFLAWIIDYIEGYDWRKHLKTNVEITEELPKEICSDVVEKNEVEDSNRVRIIIEGILIIVLIVIGVLVFAGVI